MIFIFDGVTLQTSHKGSFKVWQTKDYNVYGGELLKLSAKTWAGSRLADMSEQKTVKDGICY